MKNTPKPRKWRESFTVWIDFIGDRSQIGPLLDHIAGVPSDGGGQFLALPLSDQSWTFVASNTLTAKVAGDRLFDVFERLKAACRTRWSSYIRIRLLHDDRPDRCSKVLRKYQRGKCPDLSKVCRLKRRKRRRA